MDWILFIKNHLLHSVATLLEGEETGHDHGRGHGGQDEAEHEAPEPGEAEEEVGGHCHHNRLRQTRRKG